MDPVQQASRPRGVRKWAHWLGPVIGLALFAGALWVLHRMLREYHYHDVVRQLRQMPLRSFLLALVLTGLSYWVLTLYDVLAFRHIKRPLAYHRIALGSFLGYVFSQNIGLPAFGASAARYRVYSAWGVSAADTARVLVFCAVTFLLGFCVLVGGTLLVDPGIMPVATRLPVHMLRPLGLLLLLPAVAYIFLAILRRRPLAIRGWAFQTPSVRMVAAQLILSIVDWLVAAGVLYVLLPEGSHLPFTHLLPVFLLAETAGFLSNVPGGIGVLEGVALGLLSSSVPAPAVLGALVAYRVIYYVLPFLLAILLLIGQEVLRRKRALAVPAAVAGRWAFALVPRAVAVMAFGAGAILLLSGALPVPQGRLAWLRGVLPLSALEISHFLASLVGATLLIVARGLQRRLRTAYVLTSILLAAGIGLSLARGLHYEQAVVLGLVLALLLPCRRHFYRKASVAGGRLTLPWVALAVGIAVCFVWLGLFAHKHVEYTHDLWWRFSFDAHAPRFLRAAVAGMVVVALFALARFLRPAGRRPARPGPDDLDRARPVIARSRATSANLALLGDKSLLLSPSGNSFIMYGVHGRSWIALGDPVGPTEEWSELVWQFRELSDRHDGWTVFYEVGAEHLPLYLELDLHPLRLGEEARVRLGEFSLDDSSHRSLRRTLRKLAEEGYGFEIMPPDGVASVMPRLREVSNAWLADKHTREKGFSLGFFSEEYLRQFPAAVVRRSGEIVAFANIWTGAEKEELSIDLMRYLPGAVHGLMDYLLANIMLWGRQQGYGWFNLGMAPLSGLENHPLRPVWNRVGGIIFRHGEHFYNFQGLREYKDKFDPVWTPKYMACPGGFAVPRILANLAVLISGGPIGLVAK